MSRKLFEILNGVFNSFIIIVLVVVGLYAGYALWDNSRIYVNVGNTQAEMNRIKPNVESRDVSKASLEEIERAFKELKAINPEVCAWISLDNTMIDYPVLQGVTNMSYINTDVYGEFELSGSIFLDTRCERDFSGRYQLLYGHNMAEHRMFGDLIQYKDREFFDKNRTGILIVPGKIYDLEIFACLLDRSTEDAIFDPLQWHDDIDGLIDYVNTQDTVLFKRDDVIQALKDEQREIIEEIERTPTGTEHREIPKVLSLTTCSYEFSDARTIVLAVMRERT